MRPFFAITSLLLLSADILACEKASPNEQWLETLCNTKPHQEWNCELNRCVTKKEVVQLRDDAKKCSGMPEKTQEDIDAKKKCMAEIGGSRIDNIPADDNKAQKNIAKAMYGFSTSLTLINLAAKEATPKCNSMGALRATSIAALAGELYQALTVKKKIEELKENFKNRSFDKGAPYEAQVNAFRALKEEQELLEDIAEKKQTFYTALAVGYGATTVAAIMELSGASPACASIPTASSAFIVDLFFTPVFADIEDFLPALGGAALTLPLKEIRDGQILKQLSTSAGIAFISSAAAMLSYSLADASKEEREKAKKNVQTLDDILQKFSADMFQFCPGKTDREDMKRPECFCYTAKNEKNPDRANSKLCKDFYSWKGHNYFQKAGNYDPTASYACADSSGKLDKNCDCKKRMNIKTKEDACFKTEALVSVSIGGGDSQGLLATSKYLNGVASGNLGSGVMDQSDAITKAAFRVKEALRFAEETANKNKVKLPPVSDKKTQTAFLSMISSPELEKKLAEQFPSIDMPSGQQVAALAPLVTSKKESGITEYSPASAQKKKVPDAFSIPSGSQSAPDKEVYNFEEEKREGFDGDIVKDDHVSIWKIVSNRYMSTGYRRLFETPKDDKDSLKSEKKD